MPSVMLRRNAEGNISFYVAKKDLEETIVEMEFNGPEQWGGEVSLSDGSRYHIPPMSELKLPITVRAKRVDGADD
ncbi:putative nitrogen fixation protein FixT [Beggiatoa alba B18LD]|uniref:Putative nitrogen fixation protein FixT n=1 Tax=Beggiatoa alba B18LD TaxID=395493 RepID=I3CFW5_9GAMM|nr:putative nitrogen fixation protein NifT [Beggiatoa alba]EIJ42508.1 putative nitrogen fixation protein FixT [Beggiatoa alba B18LD]